MLHVKHACSDCQKDLGKRYPKYRYCNECHAKHQAEYRERKREDEAILKFILANADDFHIECYSTTDSGYSNPFYNLRLKKQHVGAGKTARECIKVGIAYSIQKKLTQKS